MKKYTWSIVWIALLFILVITVAAQTGKLPLGLSSAARGVDASFRTVIKIGGAFGQSGICAEFGEGEFRGATLAVEEVNASGGVNGKKLALVAEDTLCENKGVVNATRKLVSIENVSAIIGPTWGDTFQSGYPISRAENILSIGPSSALESLDFTGASKDLVFSVWFPQNREIDALQRHIAAQNLKTISIIHDQDPFGAMMGALFNDQARQNGLSIVGKEEVKTELTDFRTFIARIKAQKPEAVFASFVSPDHKAIFFKQAKELGLKARFFASADTENPALLESFAAALEGVNYTFPRGAKDSEEFARKYEERFGVKPPVSSSHAFDAVKVLVAAMKKAGTTEGDKLQDALLSIEIPGVTYDVLKFSKGHQISGGEFVVKTVRNGEFATVEK